jgi:hypothetical protein
MEQLKKYAQVCRQHYEKLILIGALILLAGAVWYLLNAGQEEKKKLESYLVPKKLGKKVTLANLAGFEESLKEATNPPALNFSGKHNTFNPVKWQQPRPGVPPIKVETGKEIGVESLQIKAITPLYLTIAFDRVATSGTAPDLTVTGYHTVVTNELAPLNQPRLRRIPQFIAPNATNTQVFVINEVKGPPDQPTSIEATLKEFDNEKISFGPGKPYVRTVGYEAELKYPATGRAFPRLRKESAVDIDGEPYKVVDITPTRVVLSDDSNGKRYAIAQVATP